jgi:putative DNA primase/helicase
MKTAHPDGADEAKRRYPPVEFYRSELPSMPDPRRGTGWQDGGLCPFHDDRHDGNFRVNLDTGAFKCFACDANGGDILDFLQLRYGCDFKQSLERLGVSTNGSAKKSKKKLSFEELQHPDAVYDYTDEDGNLLYQVLRYEPEGYDKDFRQRRPDPDKPGRWTWKMDGVNYTLFNLPAVRAAIRAGKKIMFVEGEKDVLSLAGIGIVATCIPGGANAKWYPQYSEALTDATVLVIPDNDKPGRDFAQRVLLRLKDACLLELPGLPKSGDASDWIAAGATKPDLVALARQALAERDARPAPIPDDNDMPFTPLGCKGDRYYFLLGNQCEVVSFKADKIKGNNFFTLAPKNWWEVAFMGDKGFDQSAAADNLIQRCQQVGLFDHEAMRGRGAWLDEGRTVLHQGDRLLVDGQKEGLRRFKSRYIYERAPRMSLGEQPPITADQAQQLVELCRSLPFEHPSAGMLLAGWIFLAPICGILSWRPHIWITGSSGSGKTWVVEKIIGELLGDFALKVQSVTTEAGIRQALGHDARPVTFDEAELEDQRGQMNIQRVMELSRQASGGDSKIFKGTAGGEATSFSIRSCFCLSSISVGARNRADESRVTVLSLRRAGNHTEEERLVSSEQFANVQRQTLAVCTPEYSAGLVARACKLANVIRKNADTFGIALNQVLGNMRIGQQLGTLLAGYWGLWSDGEIELQRAVEYVRGLGLFELTPDEEGRDETRCLAHLLEQIVRVEIPSKPTVERTIGELVDALDPQNRSDIPESVAEATLRRHGLKAMGSSGLGIANKSSAVSKLLANTPWAGNWKVFLNRLPGATSPNKSERFAGGVVSRVTLIPWATVNGEAETCEPAAEEPEQEDIPF